VAEAQKAHRLHQRLPAKVYDPTTDFAKMVFPPGAESGLPGHPRRHKPTP
jgi:hypothetical protein